MKDFEYNSWTITPAYDMISPKQVKVFIYKKDFGCLAIVRDANLTKNITIREYSNWFGSKTSIDERNNYDEAETLQKLIYEAKNIINFLNHVIEINTENVQSKFMEITTLNMTLGLFGKEK